MRNFDSSENRPQNYGKAWNNAEKEELLEEFFDGSRIGEIAEFHERTPASIKLKLFDLLEKRIRNLGPEMDEIDDDEPPF
jgi:hypothetical protein